MITDVILISMNEQFYECKVNSDTFGGVLDSILPVFALSSTKIIPNTVTALFIISEQHDGVSFPNESNVYMIQSHPLTY